MDRLPEAGDGFYRIGRVGIGFRAEHADGAANREPVEWVHRDDHLLAFRRGRVECWTAFDADAELPDGEVLLASGPLGASAVLPAATTVWLRRSA